MYCPIQPRRFVPRPSNVSDGCGTRYSDAHLNAWEKAQILACDDLNMELNARYVNAMMAYAHHCANYKYVATELEDFDL